MKFFASISLAASALFLAACDSSNDGSSFNSMSSRGEALLARVETQSATPVGDMPTIGRATYEGVAGFSTSVSDDVEVMSEASLTADFASSSISGELTNFRDWENNTIAGKVDIEAGTISGNQFTNNLSGSLNYNGRNENVSGVMDGGFVGANAGTAVGIIDASVGSLPVVGVLGAERR